MSAVGGVREDAADTSPLKHMYAFSSLFKGSADGDGADGVVLLRFDLKRKRECNFGWKFNRRTCTRVLNYMKQPVQNIMVRNAPLVGGTAGL